MTARAVATISVAAGVVSAELRRPSGRTCPWVNGPVTIGAENRASMRINAQQAEYLIQQLRVLVVEDNPFMRTLVRNMLGSIGVKKVFEAPDGIAGLETIRSVTPDVMILDWEMPLLNGAGVGAHRAFARRVSAARTSRSSC